MAVVILNLREFALCYSRHPGDMRVRSRVCLAVAATRSGHFGDIEFPILRWDSAFFFRDLVEDYALLAGFG